MTGAFQVNAFQKDAFQTEYLLFLYPSTSEALSKVKNYKQNHMDLSQPKSKWWHEYVFSQDFKIKVTWGYNNYFFAYTFWRHPVEFADVDDIGFDPGDIKPFKGWIFKYLGDDSWEVVVDADLPAWTEDFFWQQHHLIKALP